MKSERTRGAAVDAFSGGGPYFASPRPQTRTGCDTGRRCGDVYVRDRSGVRQPKSTKAQRSVLSRCR